MAKIGNLPTDLEVDSDGSVIVPTPQQCRIPRKMSARKTVSVTMFGTFNASYAYATIDGTKYSKPVVLSAVERGADARATVVTDGTSSSDKRNTKITLNGVEVKNAGSTGSASYDFTITDDCLIEGGYVSASGKNTIAITMPYTG